MTLDLREELERATSGLQPHPDVLDRARATGHRLLVRRRTVRAAATLGSAAAVILVAGSLVGSAGHLPFAPNAGPGSSTAASAASLASVDLPDPAPGFPYRLTADSAERPVVVDGNSYQLRQFSVSSAPKTATGEAGGASAVVDVGTFPMPGADGLVDGHPITDRVSVAGVNGIVVAYSVNKQPVTLLYFKKGGLTVGITGLGGATADQLVALGDSLTGLD